MGGIDWQDSDGKFVRNGVDLYSGSTYTTGDIIGFYLDFDNDAIWASKNGTLENGASQAEVVAGTTTNAIATGTLATDGALVPHATCNGGTNVTVTINTGQSAFNTALYTGYTGLSAKDVAASNQPSIEDGSAYMQSTTYSGAAGANSINQSGNSTFKPDMVWVKRRDGVGDHGIFDSVRTTSSGEFIRPSQANGEGTESSWNNFDNDGFSFSASDTSLESNTNGRTYVGWQWLAGEAPTADNTAGAGATPTAGSVKIDGSNLGSALAGSLPAKRLSANTKAGFSIVKWVGNAGDGGAQTVAHGLGQKPNFIFIKNLDDSENWVVYNDDVGFNALPINTSLRRITLVPQCIGPMDRHLLARQHLP